MIKLYGFPISNYYNKVKFALLLKNIPFEEVAYHPRKPVPEWLKISPLGKVPFMTTPEGGMSESNVMIEYLEDLKPRKKHYSKTPFEAAKQREVNSYLELHLELVARELYGAAFFGMEMPSEKNKERIEKLLTRNINALLSLASFKPFVCGENFCAADFSAYVHLPLVSMATKAVYGRDLLMEHGIDWKTYIAVVNATFPKVTKRINDDRKANLASQK